MDLLYARHPDKSVAEHSIIEEEFIGLNLEGKNEAVSVMIGMLRELHVNGRECRFLKPLQGYPLCELKPRIRGGQKGGARVYLWIVDDGAAGIVNCEVKDNDAPASQEKLRTAFKVYLAHQDGESVLPTYDNDDPDTAQ
jgi:hypothetical protein